MGLLTRFDTALLRPPAPASTATEPALARCLRDWCLSAPACAAASIAPQPGLDAFAGVLDGSERLARLGRWRGLLWRLEVKLKDLIPGRAPQPSDPWDCGWLQPGAAARLARWQPRRPTLILCTEAEAEAQVLSQLPISPVKPLRLLIVSAQPVPGVERLQGPGRTVPAEASPTRQV